MEVWMHHVNGARTLQIVVVLLVLGTGLACALAEDSNNNGHYNIVMEHQTCDHIIPKFIEQIMHQKTHNCDESGVFPKPGNCSVFFKCAQSDTKIQPFIEYCAVGYNFVNSVCVPNTNSSDCPQYTCRIPDGTNDIGNELENDDVNGNNFQSLPLVVPPSTSTVEPTISTESTVEEMSANGSDNTMSEMNHSDHFMQMTQTQENSSGSSTGQSHLIISLCAVAYVIFPLNF